MNENEGAKVQDAELVVTSPARGTARWPIATDVVNRESANLPDYERDQIRWMQRYAMAANATPTEITARLAKPDGSAYSWDSIYQTMTGKRAQEGANLKPFADAIAKFRKMMREVESRSATNFIETPQTRRLFKVFKTALEKRRMVFVMGDSQIGKTTAAAEFARLNNHGTTHLLRMPTGGSLGNLLAEFARRLGVRSRLNGADLRLRILESFDEHNLLIIDEAHQCLLGRTAESSAMALEFIREIYDRRGCGVVLLGTSVLRDGMKHNRVLVQTQRRGSSGLEVNLSSDVPTADLDCFAAAFGLEPAPDRDLRIMPEGGKTFVEKPRKFQTEFLRAKGLGSWIRLLEDARDLAKETGSKMTWGRVITTFCQAQAQEEGL